MPSIRFGRDFGVVDVPAQTTLLAAASRAHAPLGNACRGQGVCQACAVWVVAGHGSLSKPGALERAMALAPGWRMACKTRVTGPGQVELWTAHWGGEPEPS